MNYELAKKLKETGWEKETYWFYGSNETDTPCLTFKYNQLDTCGGRITDKGFEKFVLAYAPTLSELIEACGDRFFGLLKGDAHAGGGHCWKAEAQSSHLVMSPDILAVDDYQTPEKAVAHLWLKLNKED